jgi:hypothetical protein
MISVSEFARHYHMHPVYVRFLCRTGKIPCVKQGKWIINIDISSEKLLSVTRVCTMFSFRPRTIQAMIRRGAINAGRIQGRWYIPITEVSRLLLTRFDK